MTRLRFAIGLVLLLAPVTLTAQQASPYDSRGRENELPDDFYPTKSMVRMISEAMSEQLKHQLSLDEQQLELTRASLEENLSSYLVQNRKDVQPVLNDFMRLWSQGQPPSVEVVQNFAQRALPVWESFQSTIQETSDGWREFLTDEQNVMLDGNLAAFEVGARFMRERLQSWEAGEFDVATQWRKSPGFREAKRAEDQRIVAEQEYVAAVARGENPPVPPHLQGEYDPSADGSFGHEAASGGAAMETPGGGAHTPAGGNAAARPGAVTAAQPQDEWAIHVQQFCDRYNLNAEQRARAQQFLEQARQQRDNWQKKKAGQFARLEQLMASAKTDQGRETAKQQLDKLRQPFQTQFAKLKERLEKLPTREQRAAAAAPAPQANAAPAANGG